MNKVPNEGNEGTPIEGTAMEETSSLGCRTSIAAMLIARPLTCIEQNAAS